jgi:hypothetical protein
VTTEPIAAGRFHIDFNRFVFNPRGQTTITPALAPTSGTSRNGISNIGHDLVALHTVLSEGAGRASKGCRLHIGQHGAATVHTERGCHGPTQSTRGAGHDGNATVDALHRLASPLSRLLI